ncbi:hypothetical protein PHSY_001782 [Pseudozyma hubeiensis SY62]|uniref:t-SNARE coiled-coil homology domain-containing protein n=1 Tax=Pseudozyma hubeiensis (strain SY62) TaxID=1305764 RepID=R9NZK0_PSEHS|nr:hypothetical protein PHSY_001782 [Pseudozyma hubeiensis SY62]GAC94211.1 hypothetical protein PHSY_001782 [Pseudozyma hubeiensis SY62]
MSAASRHQLEQYLARLPSTSSTSNNGSTSASPNLDNLVQRSASLASRVDALHAQIADTDTTANSRSDDPQLFWSTLTLLTNLREVAAQLQRSSSAGDGKPRELALARTRQDIGIVESLLRMLSVSSDAESESTFTAAVGPQPSTAAPSSYDSATRQGYEYWKQRTLSAIDDQDDRSSINSVDGDDDVSDAESILTDPELHSTLKLGGIKSQPSTTDQEDYSEYDRAVRSSSSSTQPPSSLTTTAPTTSAPATTSASETILQSDRATHEALSSELLRMASVLKSNSLAFADSLERDRLLLEKAGTDLGHNLDLMTRTRGRLGVYSKKARSMGWFILSAILVVIVSWMLMFLLIRLT